MQKYWFKPKKYGWGFVPISWEGWLMTLIFIAAGLGCAYLNNFFNPQISLDQGFLFLFELVVLIFVFTIIAKPKTKGKLRWRWGEED